MSGKWHIGDDEDPNSNPGGRGFDWFFSGTQNQWSPNPNPNPSPNPNPNPNSDPNPNPNQARSTSGTRTCSSGRGSTQA